MTHLLSGHGPDEAGLEPGARGLLADAGWLRQAYVDQGWTCREIAATVGASPRSVSRALQRAGVPRRPSGTRPGSVPLPPPLDDATWLHRRYTVERRSMREIAQQAGVGQAVVARALLQYGIAARRGGRRDADQPELKDAERLRHLLIDPGPDCRRGRRAAPGPRGRRPEGMRAQRGPPAAAGSDLSSAQEASPAAVGRDVARAAASAGRHEGHRHRQRDRLLPQRGVTGSRPLRVALIHGHAPRRALVVEANRCSSGSRSPATASSNAGPYRSDEPGTAASRWSPRPRGAPTPAVGQHKQEAAESGKAGPPQT